MVLRFVVALEVPIRSTVLEGRSGRGRGGRGGRSVKWVGRDTSSFFSPWDQSRLCGALSQSETYGVVRLRASLKERTCPGKDKVGTGEIVHKPFCFLYLTLNFFL